MTIHITAELTLNVRDGIGEAPAWHASQGRLVWTDNEVGVIHEARPAGAGGWRETNRWNVGRAIGGAVPRSAGGFVVLAGTEVLLLDDAGGSQPFVRLDADERVVRGNEIKCDPQGRLWVGTRSNDFSHGKGALYQINPDGEVFVRLREVTVSNGLDWSPDGHTLYYVDSPTLSVDAFDFDPASGAISDRRKVVTIRFGDGAADGMTVDHEGCLWVAVFTSGEVRRFSATGSLLARVAISAPAVTSCAFGGADGGDLFITSAAMRLPEVLAKYGFRAEVLSTAHSAPGAGGVFVCRPGVFGAPATTFPV